MKKLRVPLEKWHKDMEKIASDWGGKDRTFFSGGDIYTEEQAAMAHETAKLIVELEENLGYLNY